MLEAEGDRLRRVRAAQGSDQDGRDEDKNESQGGIVADNEPEEKQEHEQSSPHFLAHPPHGLRDTL